ncbi:MAG: isoaspartyl peptidase/L-asparaginase [Candidatus Thorarchaeota archaeon]
MSDDSLPLVVVHGGATVFDESHHHEILDAVRRAARAGLCVFERGGSALDAAESAVWTLEETTLFTAGRGATPNADGEIELDAIVMDGHRLQSGAVMAIKGVWHPVTLARYVLERTNIAQVAGEGATKLYRKMILEGYREEKSTGTVTGPRISQGCDTVGCIAVDSRGHIACASSTSGWTGKLPGRVGDTPIVGAGVYANEAAGACCTGRGEQILRISMARVSVFLVEQGLNVTDSASRVMRMLRERTAGSAGIAIADAKGNTAVLHDTPHMPVAIARAGRGIEYSAMSPSRL